jgi:hypothetical protein
MKTYYAEVSITKQQLITLLTRVLREDKKGEEENLVHEKMFKQLYDRAIAGEVKGIHVIE